MLRVIGFITDGNKVIHTENLATFENTVEGKNKARAFINNNSLSVFDSVEVIEW